MSAADPIRPSNAGHGSVDGVPLHKSFGASASASASHSRSHSRSSSPSESQLALATAASTTVTSLTDTTSTSAPSSASSSLDGTTITRHSHLITKHDSPSLTATSTSSSSTSASSSAPLTTATATSSSTSASPSTPRDDTRSGSGSASGSGSVQAQAFSSSTSTSTSTSTSPSPSSTPGRTSPGSNTPRPRNTSTTQRASLNLGQRNSRDLSQPSAQQQPTPQQQRLSPQHHGFNGSTSTPSGHSLPVHPTTRPAHHHAHSMSHDVTHHFAQVVVPPSPTLPSSQPATPTAAQRRTTFDLTAAAAAAGTGSLIGTRVHAASLSAVSAPKNKNKPTTNPLPATPNTKVRLSMSGVRPVRSLTVDRANTRGHHHKINSADLNIMDGAAHLERKSTMRDDSKDPLNEPSHPDGGLAFPADLQVEDPNAPETEPPRVFVHHVKTRSRTSLPRKAPSPHHSPSASRSLRSLKLDGLISLRDNGSRGPPDSARDTQEFNTFSLDSPTGKLSILSIDQKEDVGLDSGGYGSSAGSPISPLSPTRLSRETSAGVGVGATGGNLARADSIKEERDADLEAPAATDNIIAQITANNINITPQSHAHHGGTMIHDSIYENRLAGIFRQSDAESIATDISDANAPKRKQVIFNLDAISKLDPDDDNIVRSTKDIEAFRPRRDSKGNIKSILKRNAKSETVEEAMERIFAEREAESKLLNLLNIGALLIKYNQNGKPNYRWFSVNDDGAELHWQKPGKNGRAPASKKKASNKKKWPQFKIANWKINADRRRCLVDVLGVHYGPYNSALFRRYVEMRDGSSGKPWLCITIEFTDRTIDIVCPDDKSVTNWFLGIQSLAPMSVHYLTKGAVLWQRLIMKLNFYGLGGLQEANERERQQLLAQQQSGQMQMHGLPPVHPPTVTAR